MGPRAEVPKKPHVRTCARDFKGHRYKRETPNSEITNGTARRGALHNSRGQETAGCDAPPRSAQNQRLQMARAQQEAKVCPEHQRHERLLEAYFGVVSVINN